MADETAGCFDESMNPTGTIQSGCDTMPWDGSQWYDEGSSDAGISHVGMEAQSEQNPPVTLPSIPPSAILSPEQVQYIGSYFKDTMQPLNRLPPSLVFAATTKMEFVENRYHDLEEDFPALLLKSADMRKKSVKIRENIKSMEEELDQRKCQLCVRREKETALSCGCVFCNRCAQRVFDTGHCVICCQQVTKLLRMY